MKFYKRLAIARNSGTAFWAITSYGWTLGDCWSVLNKKNGFIFQYSMTVCWLYFSYSIVILYPEEAFINVVRNKISIE